MRQPARVVVAAVALLGVLGLPAPAAAETASRATTPSTPAGPRPDWPRRPAPPRPPVPEGCGRLARHLPGQRRPRRLHRPLPAPPSGSPSTRPRARLSCHVPRPLPGAPESLRRCLRGGRSGTSATSSPSGRRLLRHEGRGHVLVQGIGPHPGRHPPRGPVPHQENERPGLGRGRQAPDDRGHARRQFPLAAATTYTVRVSGFVQATKGGKWVGFTTRAWSFTTA